MAELIERIAELKSKNEKFCIITVVESEGSTPRTAGARAIFFADGKTEGTVGGGSIEVEAFKAAKHVLADGKPVLMKYVLDKLEQSEMMCGGTMTLFFEPVLTAHLLTIFGGGHVGKALAKIAHETGWSIRIVDDRDGILDPNQFPENTKLIAQKYVRFIEDTQFSSNDWLVIATPQHQHDELVLENVVNLLVRYIGMMGSAKKVKQIFDNLSKKGISTLALEKVHAPIGLNIGTETPGEIAISIVSEMLAIRNGIEKIGFCSTSGKI